MLRSELHLHVESGPAKGADCVVPPHESFSIGRSEDADLTVSDTKMSRLHASLMFQNGGWTLSDLKSRNGTWVEGKRIGAHVLSEGEQFTLGKFTTISVSIKPYREPEEKPKPKPSTARVTLEPEPAPPIHGALASLPGRTVGEFRVIEPASPLGIGSYFRALQPSLNRHVLLEVFTAEAMAVPGVRDGLQKAVQSAARILHPNILQIFDFGESQGLTYVTMESFQGARLGRVLTEQGFVPIGSALRVATQLIDAFAAAVDASAPIGTLSPNDIWVDGDWTVKIKLLREPGTPPPPHEHLAYRAPEVLDGGPAAEPAAAIYTVGALLYHMLAATAPVKGEDADEIRRRSRHDTPPPLRRVNIKVTPILARVVEQAIAKDPGDRHKNLRAFARDLRRTTNPSL